MAMKLQALLDKYALSKKKLAYVKEGANFVALTTTLKVVFSWKSLGVEELFKGTCFGQAVLKGCQYGTADDKVSVNLHDVPIKSAQSDFQKCIVNLVCSFRHHIYQNSEFSHLLHKKCVFNLLSLFCCFSSPDGVGIGVQVPSCNWGSLVSSKLLLHFCWVSFFLAFSFIFLLL
jgi:hypothetical protein